MKLIFNAFVLATVVMFTGCNTVKGIGQDVSKAGDAVTNTAERTQDKIQN